VDCQLTEVQKSVHDAIHNLRARFNMDDWSKRDRTRECSEAILDTMAADRWCSACFGVDFEAAANAAKYLPGDGVWDACHRAIMPQSAMGYAKRAHVDRYLREVLVPRIAPISPEPMTCYSGERILSLPMSYQPYAVKRGESRAHEG
jgi:alkylation response protein AidB-like acyl-CoA dehydrogenase